MAESLVTDITPWPGGSGFSGASAWWDYMLGKEEQRRIDDMMGIALLNEEVRERLVNERDDSLLAAFGLSERTRKRLRAIHARSLDELAQALVSGS